VVADVFVQPHIVGGQERVTKIMGHCWELHRLWPPSASTNSLTMSTANPSYFPRSLLIL